jgi:SpoVK/Ycf46/Vps4 family AAA+-type ATPase
MPTAKQVLALIKSHVQGDNERFYSLALQLAASEARLGHQALAEELKKLLDEARAATKPKLVTKGPIPVTRTSAEFAGLMSIEYPSTRLSHMILERSLADRLRKIVHEQRQRAKLSEHGLQPRRKLLLVGPPGSGKTMTAAALAGELGLPLFSILLHGVITKFMGETAGKLRLVFDAMQETRGVYLFDEFDALGTKRSKDNDVGEARRILNSFLQFLEQDHGAALIIATTNHEELLDKALFRRFDAILKYHLPTKELIVTALKSRVSHFETNGVDWQKVAEKGTGLSQAEIIRTAEDAARSAILSRGTPVIVTSDLIEALESNRPAV